MNGFYMQCERAQGSWKDGQKVNVLCIINQNHQRWAIVVGQSSKLKDIYSMVNPMLMVDYTKNGTTL